MEGKNLIETQEFSASDIAQISKNFNTRFKRIRYTKKLQNKMNSYNKKFQRFTKHPISTIKRIAHRSLTFGTR